MDTSIAQAIAVTLAGVVAVPVTGFIKRAGIADRAAQWLTIVVSYALAYLGIFLAGGPMTPESFAAQGGAASALAMVIYRQLLKDEQQAPQPNPVPPNAPANGPPTK